MLLYFLLYPTILSMVNKEANSWITGKIIEYKEDFFIKKLKWNEVCDLTENEPSKYQKQISHYFKI